MHLTYHDENGQGTTDRPALGEAALIGALLHSLLKECDGALVIGEALSRSTVIDGDFDLIALAERMIDRGVSLRWHESRR